MTNSSSASIGWAIVPYGTPRDSLWICILTYRHDLASFSSRSLHLTLMSKQLKTQCLHPLSGARVLCRGIVSESWSHPYWLTPRYFPWYLRGCTECEWSPRTEVSIDGSTNAIHRTLVVNCAWSNYMYVYVYVWMFFLYPMFLFQ